MNGLLSLVQHQEELDHADVDELGAEIDAGIAEADRDRFVEFSAEDIIAEGCAARRRPAEAG